MVNPAGAVPPSSGSGRVTLHVEFADGTSIELPRASVEAAEQTISERFDSPLVTSIQIVEFD